MENKVISTTTSSITKGFTSFRVPRTVILTISRFESSKYSISFIDHGPWISASDTLLPFFLSGQCWFKDPCLGKQCRECDFLRLDFQVYTFWEMDTVSYHYKVRVIVSHLTIYLWDRHVIFLSDNLTRIRHSWFFSCWSSAEKARGSWERL